MDTIPQIIAQLQNVEFWLNNFVNGRVQMTMMSTERMLRNRRLLLKKLLRRQIREFNHD